MRTTRQTTPYEILCHRCNVTFPVGAKQCVHCGGGLGRHSAAAGPLVPEPADMRGGGFPSAGFPGAEEAEAAPRRSPFSPVALLWIVLFAGGTIYRACNGS